MYFMENDTNPKEIISEEEKSFTCMMAKHCKRSNIHYDSNQKIMAQQQGRHLFGKNGYVQFYERERKCLKWLKELKLWFMHAIKAYLGETMFSTSVYLGKRKK